MLNIQYSTLW